MVLCNDGFSPPLMCTRVESAVPCVLEARHRTATSCRSLRQAAAGKGSSCSEPLARVAARPGGAGRGPPPPPSTQVRAGAGSPVAGQSSTPPVLLEKVKVAGSGSGKAGPWLSTSRVRPAQYSTVQYNTVQHSAALEAGPG